MNRDKIDYTEDAHYDHGPDEVDDFDELSEQIQDDLLAWYNMAEPDEEDKDLLLRLYLDGKFRAWNCEGCGERVFDGQPDDWGHFQGARNQDFSYFGNPDKYQEDYLQALCDSCRMHSN